MPLEPKYVSHADPGSQWTAARKSPAIFTYSDNYLIDTDNAVILDGEPKGERDPVHPPSQGRSGTNMIDRVKQRFGLKPVWLTGDTAYGSGENLHWVVRKKIRPLHPGLRQVHVDRRHLVAIGLHPGPRDRSLSLPRGP